MKGSSPTRKTVCTSQRRPRCPDSVQGRHSTSTVSVRGSHSVENCTYNVVPARARGVRSSPADLRSSGVRGRSVSRLDGAGNDSDSGTTTRGTVPVEARDRSREHLRLRCPDPDHTAYGRTWSRRWGATPVSPATLWPRKRIGPREKPTLPVHGSDRTLALRKQ